MNNYGDVIKAPVVTEKSAKITQEGNKLVLKVTPKSNKIQIKQAVEKLFGVKVLNVNTINVRPKYRKVGRHAGTTSKYKKAIITLAEGSKANL